MYISVEKLVIQVLKYALFLFIVNLISTDITTLVSFR